MPLQPLAPRRLYRQIADQLRGLIRAGEFAVGSRLPAEPRLHDYQRAASAAIRLLARLRAVRPLQRVVRARGLRMLPCRIAIGTLRLLLRGAAVDALRAWVTTDDDPRAARLACRCRR